MRKVMIIFALTLSILLIIIGAGVFLINAVDVSGANIFNTAYLLITKNILPLIVIGLSSYTLQLKQNRGLGYALLLIATIMIIINCIDIFSADVSTMPLKNNFYDFLSSTTKCENITSCKYNKEFLNIFTHYAELALLFGTFLLLPFMVNPNNSITRILRGISAVAITLLGLYTIATLRVYLWDSKMFVANLSLSRTVTYKQIVTLLPIFSLVTLVLTSISNYAFEEEIFDASAVSYDELKKKSLEITEKVYQNSQPVKAPAINNNPMVIPTPKDIKDQPVVIIPMEEEKKGKNAGPLPMTTAQNIPMMSAPISMNNEPIKVTSDIKENITSKVESQQQVDLPILVEDPPKQEMPILSTAPKNVIPVDIVAKPLITNLPGINEAQKNEDDK